MGPGMSDPDNHTLRLLKKIREEVTQTREEVQKLDHKLEEGLREVTKRIESVKQLAYGESILARYAIADVEPRLFRLEEIMKLRRG